MTLPPPNSSLRACVVVPARNEEALISACLQALATQAAPDEYEVLLVLDRCTDGTEARAREMAAAHPSLRLRFLDGPGEGSGPARRVGMDEACARLLQVDRPEGLIACTDADTVVAADWLSAQLRAVSEGARAIGGRIKLADDGSLPENVALRHAEHGRLRHERLLSEPGRIGKTEHWQFSGASLALTAEVYREVGGLEPLTALEDEGLERVLCQRGIPIQRLLSVRVTTSPRLKGRARQGLSYDLAKIAHSLQSQEAGYSESTATNRGSISPAGPRRA
jgi:glucosyl-3-phosphoglycerate synthase